MATKKSLEDKIRAATTANASFGEDYKTQIESLGYYLTHGVATIGMRDPNATKATKDNPCLVAYIKAMPGSRDPIESNLLEKIKNEILPEKYRGFKLFIEYNGPVVPYKRP